MQGDTWYRNYARHHPRPNECELCGSSATDCTTWETCPPGKRPITIHWDHCHTHKIVRGALCHVCNIDEETDRRLSSMGQRFRKWRTRCHRCAVETEELLAVELVGQVERGRCRSPSPQAEGSQSTRQGPVSSVGTGSAARPASRGQAPICRPARLSHPVYRGYGAISPVYL